MSSQSTLGPRNSGKMLLSFLGHSFSLIYERDQCNLIVSLRKAFTILYRGAHFPINMLSICSFTVRNKTRFMLENEILYLLSHFSEVSFFATLRLITLRAKDTRAGARSSRQADDNTVDRVVRQHKNSRYRYPVIIWLFIKVCSLISRVLFDKSYFKSRNASP